MVLLTGCAGFIGYHTAKLLLERNMQVVGVDNLNDYYDVNLKMERLKLLDNPNFVFHKIDISNKDEMDHIFKSYDFCNIVHLAAQAGIRHSINNPYTHVNSNIIGTLNMLELMKKYNKKQLTIASTSSLYATHEPPFTEMYEKTPISPYAVTKGCVESMAFVYSYLYEMDITVLRLFTVYGKLGRPDMSYYRFIDAIKNDKPITIYGDGKQQRDFTYIDDITNGIIKTFIHTGYDIINLGTGKYISINDLIKKLEDLIGKKAIIEYKDECKADMLITQANNSKALRELSWSPVYNIDNGLKKLLED